MHAAARAFEARWGLTPMSPQARRAVRCPSTGELAKAGRRGLVGTARESLQGAPSLRRLQERAGGAHLLPVSSAARIVTRQALPASRQQCVAFLTALEVVPGVVRRLADTYDRVTAHPTDSWRGLTNLEAARVLAAGTSESRDRRLRLADLRDDAGQATIRRGEALLRQILAEPMRVGRDGPRELHSRAA
ncbi:hypothetical protein SUDANB120_06162 (plasmid) [Streptomyces sp. enrichment culture]|uniref:hypothetical protein n=1 Tax=Streptomyces sp. enrichment culture TaxID=1795815 RepID=UPI003F54B680